MPSNEPTLEVVINGHRYVKATDAAPTVDTVIQALYESYMGAGQHWKDDHLIGGLSISVNEDGEGESFEEFAALVAEIAAREVDL